MSKHETPPFRMRIEKGRLVPVSAWDQERLATFRSGSELTVQLTQQKNRKLERKYWAILHEVIKSCPVKQRTAEDLHKAIRLKLGVVDAYFTVEGKLRVDVKSTTGMDDPEYQRFFDDAMALIHEITGVDPETLSRETADVGEDEQEPSEAAPLSATDEGSGATVPIGAAADPSASQGDEGEAEQSNVEDGPAASSASLALSDEDRDWLKLIAKMLWAATGIGEQEVLSNQFRAVRENHTPETISKAARDRGNSIFQKCKLVCFSEKDGGEALTEIAMTACVEAKEIV